MAADVRHWTFGLRANIDMGIGGPKTGRTAGWQAKNP